MNCLRRTGAATFIGYAWYEGSLNPGGGPYPVHDPATDRTDTLAAANFKQAVGGRADYWLVTLNNKRSCRRKFAIVRNPYVPPAPIPIPRTGAMVNLHQLSRSQ